MKERNSKERKIMDIKSSASGNDGTRIFISLLGVELAVLLYSVWRGKGGVYVKIAAVLMPLSLFTWMIVYMIQADGYLVIWNILLLNLGFLIQAVSLDLTKKNLPDIIKSDIRKLVLAFILAFIAAIVFRFVSDWLSMEICLPFLLTFQILIIVFLHLFGEVVGEGNQAAKINLTILGRFTVQPLEFVKVLFVFILGIILCKNEYKNKKILKMPRELAAAVYILFTAVCVLSFREGGTALILLLVGSVMIFLFSDKRAVVKLYVKLGIVVSVVVVILSGVFHTKIGFLNKIYERIYFFLVPDSGYQAVQSRKAFVMGGLFGPVTNRYIVYVPRQEEDMVFSKLVGCTGIVVGIVAIGAILLMFREGYVIAGRSRDSYYKGLTMGFSLVLMLEALIHIAYNLSLFPITGIPLYFVSHGFSSLTCGMLMVAFIVVISRGTQERSLYAETDFYQSMQNFFHRGGK